MSQYVVAVTMVYLLAGVAAALAVALVRRRNGLADVVLSVLVWPLYAPLALAAPPPRPAAESDREDTLLAALRRVEGTPLASLLPERRAVKALSRSLREAEGRLAEIDAVLRRPEMVEETALDRLAASPEGPGRSSTLLRVQGIRRLRATREQLARRLQEIHDLMDQLSAQAQMVRFLGAGESPPGDLVGELCARVEALGQLLDDDQECRRS
jgi:hypothetical protein